MAKLINEAVIDSVAINELSKLGIHYFDVDVDLTDEETKASVMFALGSVSGILKLVSNLKESLDIQQED